MALGETTWIVDEETADEQRYRLRLSLRDLRELETELGIHSLEWREKLQNNQFGLNEAVRILSRALRRGEPELTSRWKPGDWTKVDEIIEKAGMNSSILAALSVVSETMIDPIDRKKKEEDRQAKAAQVPDPL